MHPRKPPKQSQSRRKAELGLGPNEHLQRRVGLFWGLTRRAGVAKGVLILRPYVQEALLFGAQHGVLSMQGRHVDGDRAGGRKIARYLRQLLATVQNRH